MILCSNPAAQFQSYQYEIEAAVLKVMRADITTFGLDKLTSEIEPRFCFEKRPGLVGEDGCNAGFELRPGSRWVLMDHLKTHDIYAGFTILCLCISSRLTRGVFAPQHQCG